MPLGILHLTVKPQARWIACDEYRYRNNLSHIATAPARPMGGMAGPFIWETSSSASLLFDGLEPGHAPCP